MRRKEKLVEDGIEFDSWEEVHFYWWCKSLIDAGYIKDVIFQPPSFMLTEAITSGYHKPAKRGDGKMVKETLMNGNVYTCDAKIIWCDKAFGKFFVPIDSHIKKKSKSVLMYMIAEHDDDLGWVSYVEVKPIFDQNNMTRLVKTNIKWVYDKYKIFINLVIPEKLFEKTFTPIRFLYCNVNSSKRRVLKIKNIHSLKDFIDKSSLDS